MKTVYNRYYNGVRNRINKNLLIIWQIRKQGLIQSQNQCITKILAFILEGTSDKRTKRNRQRNDRTIPNLV